MSKSVLRLIDSPLSWALGGFAIGAGLGVNVASVWLLAIGLGGFLVYMAMHGPPERTTEGRLFAAGVAFIVGWTAGFIVNGLAF